MKKLKSLKLLMPLNGSGCCKSETIDMFSRLPCEIRAECYMNCDALTLWLNWDVAAFHLPSSTPSPTPINAWIALLQSDCLLDITTLPLVARLPRYVSWRGGPSLCIPDASLLCRFIQSEAMLKRIIDARLPVPSDVFDDSPSPRNAVHAAMRHCWHDLVHAFHVSEAEKERFAIVGSHWAYFQYLMTKRPSLTSSCNGFFDCAARNGELALLKRLPTCITGTTIAMDWASLMGHLDIIKWLHVNRTVGCTRFALHNAARRGHIEVVKFLRLNRAEGYVHDAIFWANRMGHFHVVQYLEGTL